MSKTKTPPPVKWRYNPLDYNYPRTSKDAFGYDIKDGELEFVQETRSDTDVWVVCVVWLVLMVALVVLL